MDPWTSCILLAIWIHGQVLYFFLVNNLEQLLDMFGFGMSWLKIPQTILGMMNSIGAFNCFGEESRNSLMIQALTMVREPLKITGVRE